MGEGTGKRFSVDGLEDLRVLMDALLPRVFTGGRPGEGLFRAWPRDLVPGPGTAEAGTGDMSDHGAGGSRNPARGIEIRCLNPQTLASAGEGRDKRQKEGRHFHHSLGTRFPVNISCIRRSLEDSPTDVKRKVILNVQVKRRYHGPEGILPTDAPEPGHGSLQLAGKGSRHGEAEA
jgi:hypothetical protein